MSNLVSGRTTHFFQTFKLDTDFLRRDPTTWDNDESYLAGKLCASKLKAVNDTAERAVKLCSDFNKNLLSTDESEKQYILKCVKEYTKMFPKANKSSLSGEF